MDRRSFMVRLATALGLGVVAGKLPARKKRRRRNRYVDPVDGDVVLDSGVLYFDGKPITAHRSSLVFRARGEEKP